MYMYMYTHIYTYTHTYSFCSVGNNLRLHRMHIAKPWVTIATYIYHDVSCPTYYCNYRVQINAGQCNNIISQLAISL